MLGFALGSLLLAAPAFGGEPSQRWYTLTTPHFYVHYYRSLRHDEAAAAQKVGRVAERCHRRLAPLFRHVPSTRTHIVITDDTDGANGSAQTIPFNIIRVYLSAPESGGTLQDHDDWLLGLLMHEYTHILHLDTVHGIAKIVNTVLGRTWFPNQLQPRWFLEGLAVHQETEHTSAGRNRSSFSEMQLRAHVLEGRMLRLDQISSATRIFPRGEIPYLYGAHFVRFIADRYGNESLTRISHSYGGMPLPYALNRVVKWVTGQTYEELYKEFTRYSKERFELQRQIVLRRGQSSPRALTHHGWFVASPRLSVDGKRLVYLQGDGRSQGEIRIVDARSMAPITSFPHLGGSTVTFTPDGRHLVYGQGVAWRTYHAYHDLYVRSIASREVRRLTDGLRAREPDVSPDGRSVVFVSNELGNNRLMLIPFEGGPARVLWAGKEGEQFYTPRFSPDGQTIVLSQWRVGGKRDIVLLRIADGRRRYLSDDRAIEMDPQFSADGRFVYYSSDRSGIFNLYRQGVDGRHLLQVSNVLGGAFAPAVSPDQRRAIFIGYSSRGFDLQAIALDERRYLTPLPYVHDRPPAVVIPSHGKGTQPYPVARYNPLQTVYPRAWSFSIGADAFGTALGFEFAGSDAIERHRYAAAANLSASEGHLSYALRYAYSRFWPGLSLDTSRLIGPRGGLTLDGQRLGYLEENFGFGVGLSLPVLKEPLHGVSLALGYRCNIFRDAEHRFRVVLPGQASPRLPEVGLLSGLTARLSYSSVQRFPESISDASGRALSVGIRVDSEYLGSDFRSTELTWSWAEYFPLPWFQNHVLALRYGGGVARGDFKRRGLFAIGGFPEQNILDALLEQLALGGNFLRGYAPGALYGDQYHLLNLEYRMPVLSLERGFSSLPLYFTHVHLATFVDVGWAGFGDFHFDQLRAGVGGELLVELVLGYFVPLTLRVGYAYGLHEGGDHQTFVLIGRPF